MARAATVVAGELVSLVARPDAVPYGRCIIIFHRKRAPKNIFRQAGRTPKCDPKQFPTELKNTKIENFFGSHFGVQLTCAKNVPWLAFPVGDFYSARKGPHPVALRD